MVARPLLCTRRSTPTKPLLYDASFARTPDRGPKALAPPPTGSTPTATHHTYRYTCGHTS